MAVTEESVLDLGQCMLEYLRARGIVSATCPQIAEEENNDDGQIHGDREGSGANGEPG